jgi:hypothetical protein
MMTSYDNYILASGDELLKTYGGQVDHYKSKGLLPDPTKNIMTNPAYGPANWLADKASFVGVTGIDEKAVQYALMQFNAALGMKLQGDLHVVFINANSVPADEAEDYTMALKAYWQGPVFEKRAIAKNAVILVIGAKNRAVDWARAQTGMPFGNEEMAQWVQDWLPGKSIDPETIFGSPRTVITPGVTPEKFGKNDVTVTLSSPRGALEEIMFEKAPFKRARMSCEDGTCVGYKDLLSKIEPTGAQKTWMVIVTSLLAMLLWWVVAATSGVDRFVSSLQQAARKKRKKDLDPETWRRPNHKGKEFRR